MTIPRPRDAMRSVLALGLVLGFGFALGGLFFKQVPEANADLVNFMLGQLSVFTAGALAFYFNTSKSSADKNEVLAEAMNGTQQVEVVNPPEQPVNTLDLTGAEIEGEV